MQRIFKLSDIAKGSSKEAQRIPFYHTELSGGIVWVVEPGQTVVPHIHSSSDDLWICMQGKGHFYDEQGKEPTIEIEKGDIVLSAHGQVHGMRNTGSETFIFVSIVAPYPSDYKPV